MSLVVHVTGVIILGQVKNEYGAGDLMFVDARARTGDTYLYQRIFYKLKNIYLLLLKTWHVKEYDTKINYLIVIL